MFQFSRTDLKLRKITTRGYSDKIIEVIHKYQNVDNTNLKLVC